MKHLLLILLPLVVACGCDKDDGRYAVGDIYKHNGKTGIVVSVSKNGLHGKIISTDYVECQWSVEEEELIVTGAVDWDNGKNNMKVIRSIDGWRDKYPAFAWCADKGKDWYLPAFNELLVVKDARIWMSSARFYTSTEDETGIGYARTTDMRTGGYHASKKSLPCFVRAMATF